MKIIIGLLITICIFVFAFGMVTLCVVCPIVGVPLVLLFAFVVLLFAFVCLLINIILALD